MSEPIGRPSIGGDAELMGRVRGNDQAALATLMERWELPLKAFIARIVLNTSEAEEAFPLVRAIAPEITLDDWREYVRRRSMQGIMLGLIGADGEVCGLVSCRLGERLRHGTVLALDDFVTFELSVAAPARKALLAAAEDLARDQGCAGLELRIGSRGITSLARSRPTRPKLPRALATRLESSRSSVERIPFMAPWLRMCSTSDRVSTPWIPMTPFSAR